VLERCGKCFFMIDSAELKHVFAVFDESEKDVFAKNEGS
jgi:hypothetical protein